MPSAKHIARRRTPIVRSSAKASKPKAKAKNEAIAMRDALPFFRKGRGKIETSWWNVAPSGDYGADLETGKKYARAFLPMLSFNAGASDLGVIVSDMAKAGRDLANNPKERRGIDAVALGFMMEIGGSMQAAIVSIAIAATAIKNPTFDLGKKFLEVVEAGKALNSLNRATLFHDPTASIFDEGQSAANDLEIPAGAG
jgi:hypothetical protein